MEAFRFESESGRTYTIRIAAAASVTDELIRTLIDIDLQTFSEPTFSQYTASVLVGSGLAVLLFADDVVVGSCVMIRSFANPDEAVILAMGIRPGWRGRGLGQQFVQGVTDVLRERGIRAISLIVANDNRRAVRVYEDVGFTQNGVLVEDPRTGETFVRMWKEIA